MAWLRFITENPLTCITMSTKHIKFSLFACLLGLGGAVNAQTFITHTLNQPAALVADAGADQPVCAGDSIQLGGSPTASGGTAPFSYSWSPSGNMADPTGSNPMADDQSQSYIVIITDGNGCTSIDSVQVTALAVSASFTYIDQLLTITFTNSSTGASTYAWDFGDGNTSTASSPTHTYAADGTYTVCLTANPGGPCEDSTCINIGVVGTGVHSAGQARIIVFPNPSTAGVLNFVVEGVDANEPVSIELFDLAGKSVQVYTGNPVQSVHKISRNGLANGTYGFQVKSGNAVVGLGKVILE